MSTLEREGLAPLLKWAGGKRWLIPRLREFYRGGRYVEPFAGGLAIALALRPTTGIISDVNPHLMNFYLQVRRGLTLPGDLGYDNTAEDYYRARERFNTLIVAGEADTPEAARLFFYLNRTAYNGLCRFNQAGLFNAPFGRYCRVCYARDLEPYREQFARWRFMACDFSEVPLQPGDFVYADPPYDCPFTGFSAGGFDWNDQYRLAQWLAKHPGPVVASNAATPRILELYRDFGFAIRSLQGPRSISCRQESRVPAPEILAFRDC